MSEPFGDRRWPGTDHIVPLDDCPLCGGKAAFVGFDIEAVKNALYGAECSGCGLFLGLPNLYASRLDLCNDWNRRSPAASQEPPVAGIVMRVSAAGYPLPDSTGIEWRERVSAGTKLYTAPQSPVATAAGAEDWGKRHAEFHHVATTKLRFPDYPDSALVTDYYQLCERWLGPAPSAPANAGKESDDER